MRKNIVAGNWKMNGSLELIREYAPKVSEIAKTLSNTQVIVFPPAAYINALQGATGGGEDGLLVGGQNLSSFESGAYTGEVSASILKDIGVNHVIVGHSERRALFGETDAVVSAKVKMALANSLVPVLCVGETLEEREAGQAEECVSKQLSAVFDKIYDELGSIEPTQIIIAYEPVWAIGTGKTATPDQAQQMHAFIRSCLNKYSAELAQGCSLLYGGSVNAANAADLFSQVDIDGGLVGGASLKTDEFINICRSLG